MEKSDLVAYWLESSDKDYTTMKNLYSSEDYHWALFMGHLVVEKLLKGYYVKNVAERVPFTHDLLRLAKAAALEVDADMSNQLDLFTTFNINSRYPDYKQQFYKMCTQEYAKERINEIEGVREWLKLMISKQ